MRDKTVKAPPHVIHAYHALLGKLLILGFGHRRGYGFDFHVIPVSIVKRDFDSLHPQVLSLLAQNRHRENQRQRDMLTKLHAKIPKPASKTAASLNYGFATAHNRVCSFAGRLLVMLL
jgi:hypothetical protein